MIGDLSDVAHIVIACIQARQRGTAASHRKPWSSARQGNSRPAPISASDVSAGPGPQDSGLCPSLQSPLRSTMPLCCIDFAELQGKAISMGEDARQFTSQALRRRFLYARAEQDDLRLHSWWPPPRSNQPAPIREPRGSSRRSRSRARWT